VKEAIHLKPLKMIFVHFLQDCFTYRVIFYVIYNLCLHSQRLSYCKNSNTII